MDTFIEAIKILKDKGMLDELTKELQEAINNTDKQQQEELLNILKSDNLTIEQVKKLFMESINTGKLYKVSEIVK